MKMKKWVYFGVIGVFVVISYVWFAVFPECIGFTLPTGGWDWLGFSGVIFSVAFAVWGICKQIEISNQQTKDQISSSNEQVKKQIIASNEQIERQITANNEQIERQIAASNAQIERQITASNEQTERQISASNEQVERQIQEGQEQIRLQIQENLRLMLKQQQLSVVPCLDVNPYISFKRENKNNVFRFWVEMGDRIYNDGYRLFRGGNMIPEGFDSRINIRIKNIGLSVAMGVTVYLYKLISVDGVDALSSISDEPISNFYEKVHFKNYTYYESKAQDAVPIPHDWIIAPEYNIALQDDEVNLVFDCSKAQQSYHSILKFSFQDIYKNKYYQLLYLYFDRHSCAALPVSKLFDEENPSH